MAKQRNTDSKKEYEKRNFKYQNVCFKLSEMEEIETVEETETAENEEVVSDVQNN